MAKNRDFWISARSNAETFMLYYQWLTELAVSMFRWNNLPDGIDERYLELALYSSGQAVFFYDPDMGQYLGLRATIGGGFNPYGIPISRTAIGYNGYTKTLDDKNSVIIYNNFMRRPSMGEMEDFALRIADLMCAVDINARAQKTPVLLSCSDAQKLTLQNVYKEYTGNAPVIYGYKAINGEALSVLKTDAPYVADKLYELKTQIWNEAITRLGISNVNTLKRERLITDEVSHNLGATVSSRYSRLEMRRMAAEQINKMFGLNISVDFREDVMLVADTLPNDGEEGGVDDE